MEDSSENNKIFNVINENLISAGSKDFGRRRNELIGRDVVTYGVRTAEIRRIAKKAFSSYKDKKGSWMGVSEELMAMRVLDAQMAGIFLLSFSLDVTTRMPSIKEVGKLIVEYVDNWAICDTMANEVVAKILFEHPAEIKELYLWSKSENVWLRRGSLVSLIKSKEGIKDWGEVASNFLSSFSEEKEKIVIKAVHWLKREM